MFAPKKTAWLLQGRHGGVKWWVAVKDGRFARTFAMLDALQFCRSEDALALAPLASEAMGAELEPIEHEWR